MVGISTGTAVIVALLAAVAERVATVCSGMARSAPGPHSVTGSLSLLWGAYPAK